MKPVYSLVLLAACAAPGSPATDSPRTEDPKGQLYELLIGGIAG